MQKSIHFLGMGGIDRRRLDILAQNVVGQSRKGEPRSDADIADRCQRYLKIKKAHFVRHR